MIENIQYGAIWWLFLPFFIDSARISKKISPDLSSNPVPTARLCPIDTPVLVKLAITPLFWGEKGFRLVMIDKMGLDSNMWCAMCPKRPKSYLH